MFTKTSLSIVHMNTFQNPHNHVHTKMSHHKTMKFKAYKTK